MEFSSNLVIFANGLAMKFCIFYAFQVFYFGIQLRLLFLIKRKRCSRVSAIFISKGYKNTGCLKILLSETSGSRDLFRISRFLNIQLIALRYFLFERRFLRNRQIAMPAADAVITAVQRPRFKISPVRIAETTEILELFFEVVTEFEPWPLCPS